jgi:hypothetical protein
MSRQAPRSAPSDRFDLCNRAPRALRCLGFAVGFAPVRERHATSVGEAFGGVADCR